MALHSSTPSSCREHYLVRYDAVYSVDLSQLANLPLRVGCQAWHFHDPALRRPRLAESPLPEHIPSRHVRSMLEAATLLTGIEDTDQAFHHRAAAAVCDSLKLSYPNPRLIASKIASRLQRRIDQARAAVKCKPTSARASTNRILRIGKRRYRMGLALPFDPIESSWYGYTPATRPLARAQERAPTPAFAPLRGGIT